jgi:hypothetical protein
VLVEGDARDAQQEADALEARDLGVAEDDRGDEDLGDERSSLGAISTRGRFPWARRTLASKRR